MFLSFFCPRDRNRATHLVAHYVACFSSFYDTFVSSNSEGCRKSWVANFPCLGAQSYSW